MENVELTVIFHQRGVSLCSPRGRWLTWAVGATSEVDVKAPCSGRRKELLKRSSEKLRRAIVLHSVNLLKLTRGRSFTWEPTGQGLC